MLKNMNKIVCPNCKTAFDMDEAGFADILKQVRDEEFNKELAERDRRFTQEKESAVKLAEANLKNTLQADLAQKEAELVKLKADIDSTKNNAELQKKLAVTEAVNRVEKERDGLSAELKNKEHESQLLETSLKDKYGNELKTKDEIIKMKDEAIERLKDMKLKLSTKMVGGTLEQHCETEFNKLRSTGFQNAYFEKDNDAKTGYKGDYILPAFSLIK
jgi:hypothetical protein